MEKPEQPELLEQKLTEYLETNRDIELAWLFGSRASGTYRPDSDTDVALLFRQCKVPDFDGVLKIQDQLVSLLRQDVDLVILNNASPIIRMQVLEKGKKLLERNRRIFGDFYVRTLNEYDDLKRVRSINEKQILRGRIYD